MATKLPSTPLAHPPYFRTTPAPPPQCPTPPRRRDPERDGTAPVAEPSPAGLPQPHPATCCALYPGSARVALPACTERRELEGPRLRTTPEGPYRCSDLRVRGRWQRRLPLLEILCDTRTRLGDGVRETVARRDCRIGKHLPPGR